MTQILTGLRPGRCLFDSLISFRAGGLSPLLAIIGFDLSNPQYFLYIQGRFSSKVKEIVNLLFESYEK